MIKKILLSVTILILGFLTLVFFKPGIVVNPQVLKFAVDVSGKFEKFHWKDAKFEHEYVHWNRRGFRGHFTDLCIDYDQDGKALQTCFETINWDLVLSWSSEEGAHFEVLKPLYARSANTTVALKKDETPPGSPPDLWGYWKLLWGGLVPDFDVKLDKITFSQETKPLVFDFSMVKKKTTLEAHALGYRLTADPKSFDVLPPQKILLPVKDKTRVPLYARDFKLHGDMSKNKIALELSGLLEVVKVRFTSLIDLPLEDALTSVAFRRSTLLKTEGSLLLENVRKTLAEYGPPPYTSLPAPMGILEGSIEVAVNFLKADSEKSIEAVAVTKIDLEKAPSFFLLDITSHVPLDLETFNVLGILLDLNFRKVSLPLPRISKKSLPPQFTPDSRFKKFSEVRAEAAKPKKKASSELEVQLEALGERSINIKTNLLDEILRLNFDLLIAEGAVQKGFVQVLPLKTTIFKRPIKLEKLKILFAAPLEPQIDATIVFDLPDYKITLDLEGPLSNPRYHFASAPPLSLNDIYSVLLFGRPMADLDNDDKSSARRTNRMLSQGILNLSVLYFFAGSSIQSLDYNPESNALAARFKLSSKNSLSVGQQKGQNTAGVRRSLGKGWYLESTTGQGGNSDASYGVLLERIISY